MSQVVEAAARQLRRFQKAVKRATHVPWVEPGSDLHPASLSFLRQPIAREDQAGVDPPVAGLKPLLELPFPVRLQPVDAQRRERQRATTLFGLERLQDERLPHLLKLLAYPHLSRLKVHVVPPKASRLTEPQPARKRDAEQSGEAVAWRPPSRRCPPDRRREGG